MVGGWKAAAGSVDTCTGELYEIKPKHLHAEGIQQLTGYIAVITKYAPVAGANPGTWHWHAGSSYAPPTRVVVLGQSYLVTGPFAGVILYEPERKLREPEPFPVPVNVTQRERTRNYDYELTGGLVRVASTALATSIAVGTAIAVTRALATRSPVY